MSISPATLEDIPQLIPLINTAYNNFGGQGNGWNHVANLVTGRRINPDTPTELIYSITNSATATILKYEGDGEHNKDNIQDNSRNILGCVKLGIRTAGSGSENDIKNVSEKLLCHLGILAVSPNTQGKGIGSELMEAAENWAKSKNCSAMEITVVSARQSLIEFYERRKYVKTGATEPYPLRPGCSVPTADVHMVVLEKDLS